jgi:hypothetical protein
LATALSSPFDFDQPSVPRARDVATLSDPAVSAIFAYWNSKRGTRRMPSRADLDPVELRSLVNNIRLFDVVQPDVAAFGPRYRVRLVGRDIVAFDGRNTAGKWIGEGRPPDIAAQVNEVLTSIVTGGAPRFRAGPVYWSRDKSYRRFESCFLPLSPDNNRVNMILNAVSFAPLRARRQNATPSVLSNGGS